MTRCHRWLRSLLLASALAVSACTYDYNDAPTANPTNPHPVVGAGVAVGFL